MHSELISDIPSGWALPPAQPDGSQERRQTWGNLSWQKLRKFHLAITVIFQSCHHPESQITDRVQEWGGGEFPIDHRILRKALSETADDPPQEARPGGILAIAGPVGFHIQGQGQTGSHHADQDEGMLIADNLFLGIVLRTTERTALLSTPSGTGAINR